MPSAGTVALSNFLNLNSSVASGSSGRKRSHAEITRSESKSPSPDHLPPKRRRISPSSNFHSTGGPSLSRHPRPHQSEPRIRFEDEVNPHEPPDMATRSHRATTATPAQVVDLTGDSDRDDVSTSSEDSAEPIPHPPSRPSTQTNVHPRPQRSRSRGGLTWQQAVLQIERQERTEAFAEAQQEILGPHALGPGNELRDFHQGAPQQQQQQQQQTQPQRTRQPLAPPFISRQQDRPVIVLSDGEDSDLEIEDYDSGTEYYSDESESVASIASPEVQFLEERRIPRPPQPTAGLAHHLGPIPAGPFAMIPDMLRRGTQIVFGPMQDAAHDYHDGFLDRLDGLPRRDHGRQGNEPGAAINVTMDYGRAAFALTGFDPFDRSSETPQGPQAPYKAPAAAKEGFTRTYGEEDVILCPMCGDEIALGKGEVKQQVWVVKSCGHVYCGECATNRSKAKTPRNRKGKDRENDKKLESTRSLPFSICQVENCNTKVASKTAMFPIYL